MNTHLWKINSLLLSLLFVLGVSAQTPPSPLFIKGTMDIKFNTFNSPNIPGVRDVYNLNFNVANSVLFHGTIQDTPQIISGWVSKAVTQHRALAYNVDCDVVNPHNPAQTKNIGSLHGIVPINDNGVYNYDSGSLVFDILPMGQAGGFTSYFKGTAAGKIPNKPDNWADSLSLINITRCINGKTTTVQLKKYDKMSFNQVIIGQGPLGYYDSVTVNGELLYDYDKKCWFLNNLTAQYNDISGVKIDRIAGIFRWVPDPNRESNGLGEYDFDIRVNEPLPNPDAAFSVSTSDESSFFDTDTKIAGLTGTIKYKDTLPLVDDATSHSAVTIDLTGNNISKQQLMVLFKVIILQSIIPVNSN